MTADLEEIARHESLRAHADRFANVSYGIAYGLAFQYAGRDVSLWEFAKGRALMTAMNYICAKKYGEYMDFVLEKTELADAGFWRKLHVDAFVMNTFWIPVTAASLALGGYSWEEIKGSCEMLVLTSPFIGPTVNMWMRTTRKLVGYDTHINEQGGQ